MTSRLDHVTRLPRSEPADQGLDPAAVSELLDALTAARLELHSLMVVRHGHVVAEGWWAPYQPDGLHLLYSLSKSFTSTAVGLAVGEGLLDVDDRVVSFFPDDLPEVHPFVARMRVRHLLSMASGHHEDTLDRLDRDHLVSSFLALVPEEEPGTWFTYNNGATMMLSAILTKLTGGRLLDYLRPRLLEPLGIGAANWQGLGDLDLGFSGLHLPTEAIARFGQLYLQRGVWDGRRLVPEDWVEQATSHQVDNPREPEPDWRQGYGYQFWLGQHGYRGDGAFGQFCLVLPEEDCVVAITAATERMQAVLDCVWSVLVPALRQTWTPGADSDGDGSAAATTLRERLGRLSLDLAVGERTGAAHSSAAGSSPGWAEDQAVRVALTEVDELESGWRLHLVEEHASFAVECGYQQWWQSDVEVRPGYMLRVAASGAWTSPTTFTAEAAFVQTPHRLTLTRDVASGVTTARWNVAPLGPTSASGLALEVARA